MWMSLRNSVIQLGAGKPVAFRDARGVQLQCVSGRLWVTVEGQPGDFVLGAGQSLRIDSTGLAVVEGVPAATMRLVASAPWPIRGANRLLQAIDARWPRRAGSARAPHGTAGTC